PIIMLHSSHYLPHLHSFPTRRSSDLSIGEVAKYQNISKQTLIFYDKVGLFRPAWVDPANGYRYYSASQLDYLDTILIMKQIGFFPSGDQRPYAALRSGQQPGHAPPPPGRDRPEGGRAETGPPPGAEPLRPDGGRPGPLRARPAGDRAGGRPRTGAVLPAGGGALYHAGDQHCHQAVLCPRCGRGSAGVLSVRGGGAAG